MRIVPAFISSIETPVAAGTAGALVADFNGDGTLDVANNNTGLGHVDVMLGKGDGTFGPAVSYFEGTQAPTGLIAGDFNGDGHLDLGVVGGDILTFAPVVHVLFGNGDGTFQAPNIFPEPDTAQLGNGFSSPVAVDVNGDGKSDLVATNPTQGTAEALIGNGDGTFQPGVAFGAGSGASDVAAGDFNHDGHVDLAVAGTSLTILPGLGGGRFGPAATVAALGSPGPVTVGDLNGDLNLDLVVPGDTLPGNGDGTFQPPQAFTAQPFPVPFTKYAASINGQSPNVTTLALADLNGDGATDLVTATTGTSSDVSVLLGDGDGTFQPATIYGDPGVGALTVGDFNRDGRLDLGGFSPSTSQFSILPGNGDGSFGGANVIASGSVPNAVAGLNLSLPNNLKFFADFNGDGVPDFAVANTLADTVSVSLGRGDGTFGAPITFTPQNVNTKPLPQIVSAGDFNGDGKADLIIYNPGLSPTGSPTGGERNTIGSFSPGTPPTWTLYLSNGDGTFTASSVDVALSQPSAAVLSTTADLNGDGTQDIISAVNNVVGLAAIDVGTLTVQFVSAGRVTSSQMFQLGGRPNSLVVTDLNGDGISDIALAAGSSNQVYVLLNNGNGTFRSVNVPNAWGPAGTTAPGMVGYTAYVAPQGKAPSANGTFALKVADINQDGIPDLVAGTALGQVSVLLGNGDGTFQPGQIYDAGGTAGAIGVGDFNGDGFPDIAVPLIDPFSFPTTTPATSILLNDGATPDLAGAVTFKVSAPADAVTGRPVSVTVTALDALGNPVTGFVGTVRLSSSDPLARLPGLYKFTAADAGTHTFTNAVTFGTAGTDTVSANNPRMTAGSAAIDVRDVTTDSFTLSGPSVTTAGMTQPFTLTVRDPSGAVDTGYNGTVTFSSSDRQAGLPASYTFTTADAGMHTFAVTLKTAGTQSITASDAAAPGLSATVSGIVVTPAAATSFVLGSIQPLVIGGPGILAGTPESFTMFPADRFGNFVPTYTGTANFTSTDPQAVLPPGYTFAGDGTVPFFTVSLRTAGAQTVIATDSALPTMTGRISFSISAAAPATITLSGPSTTTAGVAQSVTVTARDAYGNVVTGFTDLLGELIDGYTGTVAFSSSDAQAGLPPRYTFTAVDAGVHTFLVTLKTAGNQSITAADTTTAGMTSTLSGIVVTPGAAASLVVGNPRVGLTGPTVTTAGVTQDFPVTVLDAFGNVASGYTGTVSFTSSDVQSGLPASYTFTAADAGVKWFSETLRTAGIQSITVRDLANAALTSTVMVPVTPAAAASFVVSGAAASTAGMVQNVTVTARDAFGNLATGYTGTVVFSSSDVQAGLPASYTFSATDAGVHTFAVTLKTAGIQSITATDTVSPTVTGSQSGIVITAGAMTHFGIGAPASAVAGMSFTIKVSALDAFGNVVTGYRGKVHLSDSATNAGLPSDYTFASSDNGVHSFSVTLNTVALQTLTVVDTTNSTLIGIVSINVTAKSSGGGTGGGGGSGGGGSGSGGSGGGGNG